MLVHNNTRKRNSLKVTAPKKRKQTDAFADLIDEIEDEELAVSNETDIPSAPVLNSGYDEQILIKSVLDSYCGNKEVEDFIVEGVLVSRAMDGEDYQFTTDCIVDIKGVLINNMVQSLSKSSSNRGLNFL